MTLALQILLATYLVNFVLFCVSNIRAALAHPFFKHIHVPTLLAEACLWPITLPGAYLASRKGWR